MSSRYIYEVIVDEAEDPVNLVAQFWSHKMNWYSVYASSSVNILYYILGFLKGDCKVKVKKIYM